MFFRAAILGLLLALAACGPRPLEVSPTSASSERLVPEYFSAKDTRGFCVTEMRIGGTANARKAAIIAFIRDARRAHIITLGVDYVDFSYIHSVVNVPCTSARGAYVHDHDEFVQSVRTCGKVCDGASVAGQGIASQVYIGSANDASKLSPIGLFQHYRPREDIQLCSVSWSIRSDGDSGAAFLISVLRVKEIYRMPILDVSVVGNRLFVLFSRQCRQKEILVQQLLKFVREAAPQTPLNVEDEDLNPDVESYIFSQTGH